MSERSLRPLVWEHLDMRRRLPDRAVKDSGAVAAGTKPSNKGFPRPRTARTAPERQVTHSRKRIQSGAVAGLLQHTGNPMAEGSAGR